MKSGLRNVPCKDFIFRDEYIYKKNFAFLVILVLEKKTNPLPLSSHFRTYHLEHIKLLLECITHLIICTFNYYITMFKINIIQTRISNRYRVINSCSWVWYMNILNYLIVTVVFLVHLQATQTLSINFQTEG